jgi:hypothetical protein
MCVIILDKGKSASFFQIVTRVAGQFMMSVEIADAHSDIKSSLKSFSLPGTVVTDLFLCIV